MSEYTVFMKDADEKTYEELAKIPGLRIGEGRVVGRIDACAAAARLLGVKAPPQLQPVDLPLPDGLRDYQVEGVKRLNAIVKEMGGALLADDMGLGKTRQATALAAGLTKKSGRVLVVCPAYVRETWLDELSKWGERSVTVIRPGNTKRHVRAWEEAKTAKWVVCSYEMAGKVYEECFYDAPRALIMDEGHLVKGRDAKRAKKLEEIGKFATYRLLMTGTPMWSRPRDFYQLLRILFGSAFGTKFNFDVRYCGGRINDWGGLDNRGVSNAEELQHRLSYYMVRREKRDVLKELPPLTRQVIWCDPTAEATREFQAAMRGFGAGAVSDALNATLRGKVEPVLDYAQQARRFLLFTYMKEHAHQIAELLRTKRDTPCVLITGDLPVEKRASLIAQARSSGQGVVATIDSAGAGLNMQGVASVGIMHAIDWVPLKLAQAEARLHRMGQTEPVQWVYFAMRESMDSVVVRNVVEKLGQWAAIMGQQSNRDLMDTLGDTVDGRTEKDVLADIYRDLQEGGDNGDED